MIRVEKIDTQADSRRFGTAFPPASIAIVGTSRTGASEIPGYNGLQLFEGLRKYGYKGRLYPVNPKAREIMGEKAYPSVVAIPERTDRDTLAPKEGRRRQHQHGKYHEHSQDPRPTHGSLLVGTSGTITGSPALG